MFNTVTVNYVTFTFLVHCNTPIWLLWAFLLAAYNAQTDAILPGLMFYLLIHASVP